VKKIFLSLLCGVLVIPGLNAQILSGAGQIHGSVEIDAQYYKPDSAIGAPAVPSKMGLNSFAQLDYTNGRIAAGVRYEAYENALQGYDSRYNGQGIANKYIRYTDSTLQVQVGNIYEQFGTGMILRSYWNYPLGIDNSIDGVGVRYNPYRGIYIKGIIGHQRYYWNEGAGIVRGADGEINLNELIPKWDSLKTRIIIGGSFVSKYEASNDPTYVFPQNVGASAGRINITNGGFSLYSEYSYKINDPSIINGDLYNPGQGLMAKASYAQKGFSVELTGERIDNMSFKSDRNAIKNDLDMNYLPTLPRDETYQLMAFYPYASQPNGEIGYDAEIRYTLPRGSVLGGHYGTDIDLEVSQINSLDTTSLNDLNTTRQGYKSNFFAFGKTTYFNNVTLEIKHKFSSKFRLVVQYCNEAYNKTVIQQETGYGLIKANIGVVDAYWHVSENHTLHVEGQGLFVNGSSLLPTSNTYITGTNTTDQGNWAFALAEFNFGSDWFIGALDEYNYGNPIASQQIHYFTLTGGYTTKAMRITLGYGKTRAGILCVGGVCRQIPASDGFTLSITDSF
jgi:hypothetical protein